MASLIDALNGVLPFFTSGLLGGLVGGVVGGMIGAFVVVDVMKHTAK